MPVQTRSQTKAFTPIVNAGVSTSTPTSLIVEDYMSEDEVEEEVEDEVEEVFKWRLAEYYTVMEQPVKSYCMDLISYTNETAKGVNIWTLMDILDETKIFAKYRNWKAQYDACFFRIPLNEWIEKTGLTREETEEVSDCFSMYMGSLHLDEYNSKGKRIVTIYGEA